MDVHISVIEDFKTANPDIEVVDWCMSGHHWVMNKQLVVPKHINAQTWRNINMDMIRKFQSEYDTFLSSFDGFIVGYSSVFAMIYEKYNKPILMLNAVRYDVPFCWTHDIAVLQEYNTCLQRLSRNGKLIAVSNNKADKLYLERATGIISTCIPSLCLYTNVTYSPTLSTFLCYHGSTPDHPLVMQKHKLQHPHQWSDLTKFRGIISIPYEISLMSLFEQFTAGIPLFFPSKTFLASLNTVTSLSLYWNGRVPKYFRQLCDVKSWIELADMYDTFQSPNTYYFDSYEHLFQLLQTFEYKDDREFRIQRVNTIRNQWKTLLQAHYIS